MDNWLSLEREAGDFDKEYSSGAVCKESLIRKTWTENENEQVETMSIGNFFPGVWCNGEK